MLTFLEGAGYASSVIEPTEVAQLVRRRLNAAHW